MLVGRMQYAWAAYRSGSQSLAQAPVAPSCAAPLTFDSFAALADGYPGDVPAGYEHLVSRYIGY